MFEKVLVKKPKRARFDFSHGNSLSMKFGMLTPTEVRFIVPGDDVSVSMEQIVRVAPMPVPTFVNMKVRHDWFFVPLSMMYSQGALDLLLGTQGSRNRARVSDMVAYVQRFTAPGNAIIPGSIHDHLGYPCLSDINCPSGIYEYYLDYLNEPTASHFDDIFNPANVSEFITVAEDSGSLTIEPLLGYHYIWRDFYRFTGIEVDTIQESWLENHVFTEYFISNPVNSSSSISSFIPQNYRHKGTSAGTDVFNLYLGKPYYAHYKKDMFTSVRYGSKPTVLIPTGSSGTIPNLREASAIQRFIDLVAVTGQRYWDKVQGLFDETPTGMRSERVQFLARYMSYIKVGEVITTATTNEANTGDYAGRGLLVDGKYLFKRHFTEHGWLFCISSIVPELHYAGLSRQLTDINMLDTPIPSLAQVGDQSVKKREMYFTYKANSNDTVLGDQFRYYAYKSAPNEVHGDFLMKSFEPWTGLGFANSTAGTIIELSKVKPSYWNKVFTVFDDSEAFSGRFFLDLTFHEYITRKLPKYMAYSL